MICDAKEGFGNVLTPKVSPRVCEGCGHTAWLTRESAQQPQEVRHEVRSVPFTGYCG